MDWAKVKLQNRWRKYNEYRADHFIPIKKGARVNKYKEELSMKTYSGQCTNCKRPVKPQFELCYPCHQKTVREQQAGIT
jgi:hypothetical protein